MQFTLLLVSRLYLDPACFDLCGCPGRISFYIHTCRLSCNSRCSGLHHSVVCRLDVRGEPPVDRVLSHRTVHTHLSCGEHSGTRGCTAMDAVARVRRILRT